MLYKQDFKEPPASLLPADFKLPPVEAPASLLPKVLFPSYGLAVKNCKMLSVPLQDFVHLYTSEHLVPYDLMC
jgi:hypothetical protein